jgi:hypothetical protein
VLEAAVVDGAVELPSARIELERDDRSAGLRALDVEELPASRGPAAATVAAVDIAAIGFATVDLDRAAASLGAQFKLSFGPAPRDQLLGASVRRSTGRSPAVLLLEPDTEGRLAAALARSGEGPVALYLRVADPDGRSAGLKLRRGDGPWGPAGLVLGGHPAGPFLILVGPAPSRVDRVPSDP